MRMDVKVGIFAALVVVVAASILLVGRDDDGAGSEADVVHFDNSLAGNGQATTPLDDESPGRVADATTDADEREPPTRDVDVADVTEEPTEIVQVPPPAGPSDIVDTGPGDAVDDLTGVPAGLEPNLVVDDATATDADVPLRELILQRVGLRDFERENQRDEMNFDEVSLDDEPLTEGAQPGVPLPDVRQPETEPTHATLPGYRAPKQQTREHLVQPGDTLWTIAEYYYADGRLYRRIVDANPDLDPTRLPIGKTIRIPPAEDPPETTSGATATKPARPGTRIHTYVVEHGDTLYKIAKHILKDGTKWRSIYELNRDKLSDPDRLVVGMELRIPE